MSSSAITLDNCCVVLSCKMCMLYVLANRNNLLLYNCNRSSNPQVVFPSMAKVESLQYILSRKDVSVESCFPEYSLPPSALLGLSTFTCILTEMSLQKSEAEAL